MSLVWISNRQEYKRQPLICLCVLNIKRRRKLLQFRAILSKDCYIQVLIPLHFSFAYEILLERSLSANYDTKLSDSLSIIYVLHSLELPGFLHAQYAKVQN